MNSRVEWSKKYFFVLQYCTGFNLVPFMEINICAKFEVFLEVSQSTLFSNLKYVGHASSNQHNI